MVQLSLRTTWVEPWPRIAKYVLQTFTDAEGEKLERSTTGQTSVMWPTSSTRRRSHGQELQHEGEAVELGRP